jgi:hypothetical protein
MVKGIAVNGKHSYHNFGLRMLKRNIGAAPKDDYTERVPYSSVTHDFSRLCGSPTYGERTLSYTFEYMDFRSEWAEERLFAILEWLHFAGRIDLYDDMLPNHHFEVREPAVSWTVNHRGIYTITVNFKANPAILPNRSLMYSPSSVHYPDVNEDGVITSADASAILDAAADIAAGEDTGLTPAQLRACDANLDGKINSIDASLVLEFYSLVQEGIFEGDVEGWTEFLNYKQEKGKGVV